MKKIGIVISLILLLINTPNVLAQDSVDESAVPKSLRQRLVTLVTSLTELADYFAAGETVALSGTARSDAYIAGSQVFIDGRVGNDLLAAGGMISLSGVIGHDVRLIGGNITINGTIGNNVTIAGGNVEITPEADIGGNLVITGGNVIIAAPIKGNVTAVVGNLTLANSVDGNVKVKVGQLTLTPKALIKGDLDYQSPEAALISPEATVSGTITHTLPSALEKLETSNVRDIRAQFLSRVQEFWGRFTSAVFMFSFLNALVVGFLLVNFFPNFSYQSILSIEEHPWKSMLIGLMAVIITPIAIILSLDLIIGVSFALVLTAIFAIYLYLAKLIFSYWLGARFIQGLHLMAGPGVTLFVGLGLFYLLSVITYVGPVMRILAILFGLGGILRAWRSTYLQARVTKII